MKNQLKSLVPSLLGFFVAFLIVTWVLDSEWHIGQALVFTAIFGIVMFVYETFIKGKTKK